MALNISAWSIRNPLPSVVFSIILLVLGWVSFTKLAVTRLPSADIPVISVAVSQFGAAPAELESQVTKTIEDGVSGVEGVRHISSSITDGLSLTTIQFALETNTDRALNDIKDAVTRVRANLPHRHGRGFVVHYVVHPGRPAFERRHRSRGNVINVDGGEEISISAQQS